MSDVNIPLLRKAVEWAEVEAQKPAELCEWQQGYYVLPASEKDAAASGIQNWETSRKLLGLSPECGTAFCIAGFVQQQTTGSIVDSTADTVAAVQLGLSDRQAFDLFRGSNTIDDVRRIAEQIAGERL